MRVLVTGCAGFIGLHTCLCLLERGDEVVGIDNLNDYYDVNLKKDRLKQLHKHAGFSFHELDITQIERGWRACSKVAIFRVSSIWPRNLACAIR